MKESTYLRFHCSIWWCFACKLVYLYFFSQWTKYRRRRNTTNSHTKRIFFYCHSSNFLFGGLWCPFPKTNDTMCRIFMSALLPACLLAYLCWHCVLIRSTGMNFMFDTHIFIWSRSFVCCIFISCVPFFLLSIRRLWPNTRYLLKREENTSNFKDNLESYMCITHFLFWLLSFLVHQKSQMRIECFLSKKGK